MDFPDGPSTSNDTPFPNLVEAKDSPNLGEYRLRGGGSQMAREIGHRYPRLGFEKRPSWAAAGAVVRGFPKIVDNRSMPHGDPISEANRG